MSASPAELIERYQLKAGRLITQAAAQAKSADPAGVLAALRRHREILADQAQTTHEELMSLVNMEVSLVNQLEGSPAAQGVRGNRGVLEVFDEVTRTLDEMSRPAQAAAAFLRLAWIAALADQEITGLALLHEAAQVSPDFAARNSWIIEVSRAFFLDREGSNRYQAGDRAQSMTYCLGSLEFALGQGRTSWAERLLTRVADLAAYADQAALINAVAVLARLAPLLARMLDRVADQRQRQIYGGLFASVLGGEEIGSEILWDLLQYALGLRTAMTIAAPRLGLISDPRAAELLTLLEQDRKAMLNAPPVARAQPERVSLREAFEERRRSLLIEVMPQIGFKSLQGFRDLLDDRTIVLALYPVQLAGGLPVVLGYAVWTTGQALAMAPSTPDDLGEIVRQLGDTLDELRRTGLNHICIYGRSSESGNSPHLIRLGDGLLADHWLVTSLPHPHVLFPLDADPDRLARTEGVVAFGLGFESGPHEEPPIPDAPAEAVAIAALAGGLFRVNDAATIFQLRDLVPRARRLHVATHGRFTASTPSFHHLLLTPGAEDDGVLYAWEIAELDLAGLELATLSACESAETAVDLSGNTEGIPIALMRAGARAVIGTLWEVETTCSRAFFELLYAQLAAGASRGDAFRAAQCEIRRRFPDERDWPAFFLIGDWR